MRLKISGLPNAALGYLVIPILVLVAAVLFPMLANILNQAQQLGPEVSMLSFEEMPDDNEDLAKININFPPIPNTESVDPNIFMPEMLEYLELEGFKPDGELKYLRTALVEETSFWIWEFTSDNEKCYATVDKKENAICYGCDTDYFGLTPEQFILGTYHQCF